MGNKQMYSKVDSSQKVNLRTGWGLLRAKLAVLAATLSLVALMVGSTMAVGAANSVMIDDFNQKDLGAWLSAADGKVELSIVDGPGSPALRIAFDLNTEGWGGFVAHTINPAVDIGSMTLVSFKARDDGDTVPVMVGVKLVEQDDDKWETRVEPGHGQWATVAAWLDEFQASWDCKGDKVPFNTPIVRIELFPIKEKDNVKVPGWVEVDDVAFAA